VAVNDSNFSQICQRGFVEEFIDGVDGFVSGLADDVQF
jgi:hypothetical protein